MARLTADERAVRDLRILKLYTYEHAGSKYLSIREVAGKVGLSAARVRDVLVREGVVRHRGDPGVRPGPRRDPDAASHRTPIAYRPDTDTRRLIDTWAKHLGVSRAAVVDSAVKRFFTPAPTRD